MILGIVLAIPKAAPSPSLNNFALFRVDLGDSGGFGGGCCGGKMSVEYVLVIHSVTVYPLLLIIIPHVYMVHMIKENMHRIAGNPIG